jgi:putative hydrolase of the HAD superfamily
VDCANAVMFEDLARNLSVPKRLGMKTVLIVPRNFEATFSEVWERDDVNGIVDHITDDLADFLGQILALHQS